MNNPIIVEETYGASVDQVWKAITNLEEMKKWYFDIIPEFKAEVGFKTHFLVENDGRKFTHCWEVTEVVPNQKITYTWTFSEYNGSGYTTWELSDEGDSTRLTLTNVVTDPYPADIPEFKRESGVAGWNYFVKQQLKNYLAE